MFLNIFFCIIYNSNFQDNHWLSFIRNNSNFQFFLRIFLEDHYKNSMNEFKCQLWNWSCLFFIEILLFWFCFICLHHRALFHISCSISQAFVPAKKDPRGSYYVQGVDQWIKTESNGLADFVVHNILALPQSSSIKHNRMWHSDP